MAMHSNPKKWDRMLDEGTVLRQSAIRCGTILPNLKVIFWIEIVHVCCLHDIA